MLRANVESLRIVRVQGRTPALDVHLRPVELHYQQDAALDVAALLFAAPFVAGSATKTSALSLRLYVMQRLRDSGGMFAKAGAVAAHAAVPARIAAESVMCMIDTRRLEYSTPPQVMHLCRALAWSVLTNCFPSHSETQADFQPSKSTSPFQMRCGPGQSPCRKFRKIVCACACLGDLRGFVQCNADCIAMCSDMHISFTETDLMQAQLVMWQMLQRACTGRLYLG